MSGHWKRFTELGATACQSWGFSSKSIVFCPISMGFRAENVSKTNENHWESMKNQRKWTTNQWETASLCAASHKKSHLLHSGHGHSWSTAPSVLVFCSSCAAKLAVACSLLQLMEIAYFAWFSMDFTCFPTSFLENVIFFRIFFTRKDLSIRKSLQKTSSVM